jgi:hypothetical protein
MQVVKKQGYVFADFCSLVGVLTERNVYGVNILLQGNDKREITIAQSSLLPGAFVSCPAMVSAWG